MTSHLVSDPMLSFMMPFDLMSNCAVEQPVFAANYIKGTIQAASNGKWSASEVYFFSPQKLPEGSDLAHAGIQRKLCCSIG